MVTLMFFSCDTDNSGSSTPDDGKLYAMADIGPSGIGIVFYITEGGLHGLEAAPSLWSGGMEDPKSVWIEGGESQFNENGNTFTDIGKGLANSNAIIAQTDHESSAAKICRDYAGGGLTDWFLPSRNELNELFKGKDTIGGFGIERYWTSCEYDIYFGMYQSFDSGTSENIYKESEYRVRPVRAF